ncbi:G patch domain-containing protein 1-like [Argonauta hians]
MADSDDEADSYVVLGEAIGTILPDEPLKRPQSINEIPVRDKQGRVRFHGAFTGGFSAGYFNSVGSKEGWAPSTFVSSRENRNKKVVSTAEDFMDDEDFSEHGIAPRKIVTSDQFQSEDRTTKRKALAESLLSTNSFLHKVDGALLDFIVPEKLSIGVKLLRKMGWKEGQGVGPRKRRRRKKAVKTNDTQKTYGCAAAPPGSDSSDNSDDHTATLENVEFAPKDMCPFSFRVKDNLHGLGYSGINIKAALPSTHVSLFSEPSRYNTSAGIKKNQRGIEGVAFGIGAMEEDDEDIYAMDSLSKYDQSIGFSDDKDDLHGWTAPGRNKPGAPPPPGYAGKILEGFTLSSKPLTLRITYGPPQIPKNYRPYHSFEELPVDLQQPSAAGGGVGCAKPQNNVMNALARSIILGETNTSGSVFDLISKSSLQSLPVTKPADSIQTSLTKSVKKSRWDRDESRTEVDAAVSTPRQPSPREQQPLPAPATSPTPSQSQLEPTLQITPSPSQPQLPPTTPAPSSPPQPVVAAPPQLSPPRPLLSSSSFVEVPQSTGRDPGASAENSSETSKTLGMKPFKIQSSHGVLASSSSSSALQPDFKPFAQDPAKQDRYDKYLLLLKHGKPDPYSLICDPDMTGWEHETEKDEFARAARLFKPLAAAMASRFTKAKFNDDAASVELPEDMTSKKKDLSNAADMKLYGKLTREIFDWHPATLLCCRFNVPDPHPGSGIIGVPKVKRDKYSIFDFLAPPPPVSTEKNRFEQDSSAKPCDSPTQKTSDKTFFSPSSSASPSLSASPSSSASSSSKTTSTKKPSIFSHLMTEKPTPPTPSRTPTYPVETSIKESAANTTVNKPVKVSNPALTTEDGERPPMDLFKAIFADSSSSSSSDSEEVEDDEEEKKKKEEQGREVIEKKPDRLNCEPEEVPVLHSGETPRSQPLDSRAHAESVATPSPLPPPPSTSSPSSSQPPPSYSSSSSCPVAPQSSRERDVDPKSDDPVNVYGPALPPTFPSLPPDSSPAAASLDNLDKKLLGLLKRSSSSKKHKRKTKHSSKKSEKDKHQRRKDKKKDKKNKKKKKRRKKYSSTSSSSSFSSSVSD